MNFPLRPLPSVRAVLVALLLLVGLSVAIAESASAHARLVSISPADGATLTTPPTQVVVTFDDTVTKGFSVVSVKSGSGAVVSQGKASEVKGVVTEQLAADLPGGTYAIAWKVLSDDGHPVSGTSTFIVKTDDATPLASGSSGPPAATSSSSSAAVAAPSATSTGSSSATSSGGIGSGAKGLLYIIALAAVVYGILGVFRARRKQQAAQRHDQP